jgi:hypothetical protein
VPQNHFTFYAQPQGYYPNGQPYPQQQQQQQTGAPYAGPPPMYNGEAPPQYYAPQGGAKPNTTQSEMEMPQYGGSAPPQGQQQSGVVGRSDVEQGQTPEQLPPRPQQAKAALRGMVDRFRR